MSIDPVHDLKTIILGFRVTELTQLLAFCNLSRLGRKSVLQERALELLKKDNLTQKIQFKIRELSLSQNQHSAPNKTLRLPELPQDSSSNECTITDIDMSHPIGYNSNKSQVADNYYSMPKFDFGPSSCNPSLVTKLTNAYGTITKSVQFKPIPFDDVLYTIVEPTILPAAINNKHRPNNYDCQFSLKPEQANEISMARELKNGKFEYTSQIHLRFCIADTFTSQDDLLPLNLVVRINNKSIALPTAPVPTKPNMESKRPSKPIDLTPNCKLSPVVANQLSFTWTQDTNNKNFCFTVYLVRKLTSKDLLNKLEAKGVTDSAVTKRLIISKLTDTDNEISTTSLKGNLSCPLGKMRLRLPVRSSHCSHIQCFDAELYLQMNEKKPSWLCPVCDRKAEYKTLFIDGLFMQILKEAPADSNEIEFTDDGGWRVVQNLNKTITLTPQRRKIEEETLSTKKSKTEEEEEVIELSSDSEDDNNENLQQPLHMPKMTTFGDNNVPKSIGGTFNQFSNPFSSQTCGSQAPSSILDQTGRGQSRGLITSRTSHGASFGNFNSHNMANTYQNSSGGAENSGSMLRGRGNSEPSVISID